MRSSIASGLCPPPGRPATAGSARWRRVAGHAGTAAVALALAAGTTAPVAQPVRDVRSGSTNRLPAQLPPSEQKSANDAYTQAVRLAREGDRDAALRTAEAALRTSPSDARLRFLRGVLLTEAGRRADAIDAFESLVADYPELPEPYNNLAVLHAAGGDLDKARAALESAIRALPDYALAYENLGDVYLRMGARAYEMALRAAPQSRPVQDKLALARELLGRVAPAGARAAAPDAVPVPDRPPQSPQSPQSPQH